MSIDIRWEGTHNEKQREEERDREKETDRHSDRHTEKRSLYGEREREK